jgi:type I restriction enzyme M protein
MAVKKQVKEETLEKRLYDTAEILRGNVSPTSYKDIALGLLFLKYISNRYDVRQAEITEETKDSTEKERNYLLNLKDQYTAKGVFYLKEGDNWKDLAKNASSEKNLAIKIDEMIQQIETDNQELEGVLPRVFAGSGISNDNLQQLIETFDTIPTDDIENDSFGKIYEYFLKNFHKKIGQKGGEFFTPESIVQLLVEIIEPYEGIIYDPTCGSGGMFVQSKKFQDAHKNKSKKGTSIYGVESQRDIWRIAKMNLTMRGIEAKNILRNNCLLDHPFEKVKANRILANPPFNMGEWGHAKLTNDAMFAKYGVPGNGKPGGNYAFMSHMIHHLDENNGKLGLVLSNGSMSTSGKEDSKIRQKIIEDDLIDCMVALPSHLFYTVILPACLWFVTKNKDDGKTRKRKGETLFIDARKIFTSVDRSHNELSEKQIQRIAGTYRSFIGEKDSQKYENEQGYCKVATIKDIEKNKFILHPGRYVGAVDLDDDDEPFPEKMQRLTQEFSKLTTDSINLDKEINKNLKSMGFGI